MNARLRKLASSSLIGAVAVLGAGACKASANTVVGPRETVRFDYTTTQPHAPTGLTYDLAVRNPNNSNTAPIPVRRITVVAPQGSRLDPGLLPACTASDMQMELQGESACPPTSKLATGTTVTRPLGGLPFTSAVAVFNAPGGQAMMIKFGSGASAVVHTTVDGRTSATDVPTCLTGGQPPSGCPADEDAVVSSDLSYPAMAVGKRAYLLTPSSCPSSRAWKTVLSFTYADGVTDTLTTSQPCSPVAGRDPAARERRAHHTTARRPKEHRSRRRQREEAP